MNRLRRVLGAFVILLCLGGASLAARQQPPPNDPRVAAGAAFLKAGESDLAVRALSLVLDTDPGNWRARSLLTLAFLSGRQVEKAQAEFQRLKALNVPPETLELLARHLQSVQRDAQLRDSLTQLLHAGKSDEALRVVEQSALAAKQKLVLRAYVAVLKGEYDDALTLLGTADQPELSQTARERQVAFGLARDQAVLALNFLSNRFCRDGRRCMDQPPLSPSLETFWEQMRTGNGRVLAFPRVNAKARRAVMMGAMNARRAAEFDADGARRLRDLALESVARFAGLAPLHTDALAAATVVSFHTGSKDALLDAANREVNALGSWSLRIRDTRPDIDDEKKAGKPGTDGLLVFDDRARVIRYSTITPTNWISSIRPVVGRAVFEVPYDSVTGIRSRPKTYVDFALAPAREDSGSVLFDFGANRVVPMNPDFIWDIASPLAAQFKAIEDIVSVAAGRLPRATVQYEPKGPGVSGFYKGLLAAGAAVDSLSGSGGTAGPQGPQLKDVVAVEATQNAQLSLELKNLRARDGAMLDTAFENEPLKAEIETLLARLQG